MGFLSNRWYKKIISTVVAGVILLTSLNVSAVSDESGEPGAETTAAESSDVTTAEESAEATTAAESDAKTEAETTRRDYRAIVKESQKSQDGIMSGSVRTDLYQYYFAEHKDVVRPNTEIVIEMGGFASVEPDSELKEEPDYSVGEHNGKKDCFIWRNDLGRVEYNFNVEQTGLYNLEFLYQPIGGKNNAVEFSLMIDGGYPFTATRNVELDKYWKNEGVIEHDAKDNQMLPRQDLFDAWITYPLKDREGLFNEPYFFYLEEGKHTITINGIKVNGVAFKSMTFKNYPPVPEYEKPANEQINSTAPLSPSHPNDIGSNTMLVQGQTPEWRSSTELVPTYDNGTYLVNPSHPVKMRYNTVGGSESWNKAGQSVTWEFNVPADGYYRFSAKVKQNMLRGFSSNRRVLINGKVPCDELDIQQFPYKTRWYQKSFTDKNGDDIYIELKAGINHITLEAVPGQIGEILQRLDDHQYALNYYYRRILMITGPKPDLYNPYYVDQQIPELIPEFERIRDSLREEKKYIESLTGSKGGSEAAALETMAVILDLCIKDPDRIPARMESIKDNIGSLSAWIRSAGRQPLEIDYIEIATAHENFGNTKPNFWSQILFLWNGFIGSFFEDYTRLDDGTGLSVWVGLGRDQALCLKHLVDSDYNFNNPSSPVSINLVQGSILEATLAGKGPEVALFIGGDFPIQLAARDLTVDISKFDDYQEIVEARFAEQLPVIFSYLDGVYGLPLSQMFPMIFYRTDILEDLELEPPKTWDDFIKAIAVLKRAYLEIGLLPPTSNLTSQIFEPGETFTMLQLQTGDNFYVEGIEGVEDYSRTTFDTEASVKAFTTWTDFYTVHQFDQTFDPFTRFRTGEMPIVIMPYGFYNQVFAAAPEIRGLWDFRHVPGTMRTDENGGEFLDISASSASACGLIFNKTKNKDAAWEFLKWLTSDEVQSQFGQNMEAMLGPLGRYDTANKNALANLAWSARDLRRLEEQRDALVEIPMIPANYAATRHIKNAFRAVVNENWFPRYALESYNRDINAEIARKNAELLTYGS
jgi:ABC-type glycerol-3-phosphate transport system substrate-binding protein